MKHVRWRGQLRPDGTARERRITLQSHEREKMKKRALSINCKHAECHVRTAEGATVHDMYLRGGKELADSNPVCLCTNIMTEMLQYKIKNILYVEKKCDVFTEGNAD